MKRTNLLILLCALGIASFAQTDSLIRQAPTPFEYPFGEVGDTSRGVFGADDRKEASESTEFEDLVRATAVMVHRSKIKGNRVYSETLRKRLSRIYGSKNFSDDMKFLDQPACATCTGFLIAPDILVTAGHCVETMSDMEDYVWLFDFTIDKNYNAYGGYFTIDPNDVYEVKEVMGAYFKNLNTMTDYSFLRLNRESNREPYRFRTSNKISTFSDVYTIGSPTGLPLKLADNAWVVSNVEQKWFKNSIDGFPGNSGGPVFNEGGFIEGIHVRGAVELSNGRYTGDYKYDKECNCIRTVKFASTYGTAGSHAHRITEVPMNLLHEALYSNMEYAIRTKNTARLERWLVYSWFLNHEYTNAKGRLEFVAAKSNNLDILTMVIDKSRDANVVDAQNRNLLFYAVDQNNMEMLNYLLRKGVSPNKADKNGISPLHYAISRYNTNAAKILIQRGGNVAYTDSYGENALHKAARQGNMELVKAIVERGIDAKVKNNNGHTARKVAAKAKNKSVKKYLKKVEKGKI